MKRKPEMEQRTRRQTCLLTQQEMAMLDTVAQRTGLSKNYIIRSYLVPGIQHSFANMPAPLTFRTQSEQPRRADLDNLKPLPKERYDGTEARIGKVKG